MGQSNSPYVDLFGNQSSPPCAGRRPLPRPAGGARGGPEGEACKTCVHAKRQLHHDKYYWKCELVAETRGPGTDIRLKSPACHAWNPGTDYLEEGIDEAPR
jgi:hypothetical protein